MDQQILRIQQTCALLGLSRSTLYRMIAKGEFPAPTRLSTRAVGWQAGTVHAWLSSRSPGALDAAIGRTVVTVAAQGQGVQ